MNSTLSAMLSPARRRLLAGLAAGLAVVAVRAFPPAPDHQIYGYVRNELGIPLTGGNAEVLLEANNRILTRVPVFVDREPGVNYRLSIPLDSGVKNDLYTPTALRPTVPFQLRVKVGNLNYLPIEMLGASKLVTRPGALSRVDLTLGVDSDGDGIPDAWEQQLIAALGGGKNLGDVRPGDDADGDGLSNLQEYLAGTYAFDPADGFNLSIVKVEAGQPVLEFLAIRGRTYSIRESEDLANWTPVAFKLSTDAAGSSARQNFRATDTRVSRPVIESASGEQGRPRFFKLFVN
jgi:hypothetical protein